MHDFKVQNFQFYKAVPFVGEISSDACVFMKNNWENCILLSLTIGTKILLVGPFLILNKYFI